MSYRFADYLTERPSETCRVSLQNKIHLIQWCIYRHNITMHGPVDVNNYRHLVLLKRWSRPRLRHDCVWGEERYCSIHYWPRKCDKWLTTLYQMVSFCDVTYGERDEGKPRPSWMWRREYEYQGFGEAGQKDNRRLQLANGGNRFLQNADTHPHFRKP